MNDPVAGVMLNWQTGLPGSAPREYDRLDAKTPRQYERIQPSARLRSDPNATHVIVQLELKERLQPQFKTEKLGTQDVSGATCQATRTTTTYPVGFFGNDRPITSTQETCTSQEFGRALQETQEDPRSGTRTTTVQSFSRGEPDPALFQLPADYTEPHVATSGTEIGTGRCDEISASGATFLREARPI